MKLAWINTQINQTMSLPTRERGLKLFLLTTPQCIQGSLPTRERGLKPVRSPHIVRVVFVAPHAGAWIETRQTRWDYYWPAVAPHAGAWIETESADATSAPHEVAPHAGAWIETRAALEQTAPELVAPHAGAWIETWPSARASERRVVAPHAGAWIETIAVIAVGALFVGRSPCGSVD